MLGIFKRNPKLTDEQIKEERAKNLEKMLEKSQELDRLIKAHGSGWKEFAELISDYIDKAKKRKAITALDRATEQDIYQLKLLDHEIYILSWILKIPEQFIGKVEAEIKAQNKENE